MMLAVDRADEPGVGRVYNLGTDETIVRRRLDRDRSARTSASRPRIEHTGGERGWAGDSPLIHLDCSRIRGARLGPTLTIREADRADARLARRRTRGCSRPRARA